MRTQFLLLASALALTACSQAEPDRMSDQMNVVDASESAGLAGPDIDPIAAPGVAFTYNLTLGVPDRRISALQEKHADACVALGLTRCQIVGMNYQLVDEDRVEGSMRFLLVPTVATDFAREATTEAEKVGGRKLASQFNGQEVQIGIDQSRERSSAVQDRIDAIERELRGNVSRDRRAELNDELANLRSQLIQERQTRQGDQKRLNLSPLDIRYAGASVYSDTPLSQIASEATRAGKGSLTLLFTVLVYLVTVVLPWLLALALLVLGLRWVAKKTEAWRLRRAQERPPHDAPDDPANHP